MAEETIAVEVVHAGVDRCWLRRVRLPAGSTVMQAIEASELARQLPEGTLAPSRLGIFSRKVDPDQVLRDGDRVEIYRPLALDPMTSRRQRAGRH